MAIEASGGEGRSAPGDRRWRETVDWRLVAGVAGLVVLAFFLRRPLFTDALFGDELSTHFVVDDHGIGRLLQIVGSEQEGTPPLYFLLASATQHLGSSSDWLRLPSLICGLALIPLTYLLGKRLVGTKAALVAAAIVCISPFLIYYSTEARAYATSACICLLSTLALLEAIERERRLWWGIYAVLIAAAMYTHYTSLFVLAGQTGWALLARPKARMPLLLATAAAAVLYIPWIPGYLDDQSSGAANVIALLQPFTFHFFRVDLQRLVFGSPYLGVKVLPGTAAVALIGAGLLVGAAGSLALARRRRRLRPPSNLVLVAVLASASVIGASVFSLISDDVYLARNLIASWPGIALLFAVVITSAGRLTSVVASVLVLGGYGIGTVMMLNPDNQRPDYDSAAAYIGAHSGDRVPVVDQPFQISGTKVAIEAALEDRGDDRTVLRLGMPTLADMEAVRAPNGPGQFHSFPPVPEPAEIADEVVRDARGGPFFLEVGGDFELSDRTLSSEVAQKQPQLAAFLQALPPDYHQVAHAHFDGLVGGVNLFAYAPRK